MTHDRTLVMHFAIDPVWLLNFNERFTFYAVAMVVGTTAEASPEDLERSH